jgi:ABC-type Fe3+-siderophore transport system permease subunit
VGLETLPVVMVGSAVCAAAFAFSTYAPKRSLLPIAAIGGAIFMIWADTGARALFAPREIPVGIVTALLGTPVFLLVLVRFRHLT